MLRYVDHIVEDDDGAVPLDVEVLVATVGVEGGDQVLLSSLQSERS